MQPIKQSMVCPFQSNIWKLPKMLNMASWDRDEASASRAKVGVRASGNGTKIGPSPFGTKQGLVHLG